MEERLRALSPQRPSPELRERVLRHARAALAPPVTWRARLWASWGFRWGWAVGFVLIVVAGSWSQRSFEKNRWGSAAPDASRAVAENSPSAVRETAIHAALRIEKEMRPSDAAVLGGGDPNRCDRDRALWEMSAADAHPHRGSDRSRGTWKSTTIDSRRLA
jgi:hypothetical protein